MELDAADVGAPGDRHADREDAKSVSRLGLKCERPGGLDDQVGPTEQPALGPVRQGRKILRPTMSRSGLNPPVDERNLLVGQRLLVHEMAHTRLHLPRGHEAAACDRRDQGRAPPNIVVGRERERRRTAATMTRHTRVENNGRDVASERDVLRKRGIHRNRGLRVERAYVEVHSAARVHRAQHRRHTGNESRAGRL
jgi:hypothetical protein